VTVALQMGTTRYKIEAQGDLTLAQLLALFRAQQ
jgi:hypothetical protein